MDGWLRQWVIGALAAIVMAGGSWWVSSIDAQQRAQREQSAADRERLASLEATVTSTSASTQRQIEAISAGLKESRDDINGKLDLLIKALTTGGRGPSSVSSDRSHFDK